MKKVYLAARFPLKGDMEVYANRLKEDGHEIVASWVYGGENCLSNEDIAVLDLKDIDRSDTLVLFTSPKGTAAPGGGRFVEFGYALAKGKKTYVVGEKENVFTWHPDVINLACFNDLRVVLRD
jgi:nucleoside 2-deoxyribosyltransferase